MTQKKEERFSARGSGANEECLIFVLDASKKDVNKVSSSEVLNKFLEGRCLI